MAGSREALAALTLETADVRCNERGEGMPVIQVKPSENAGAGDQNAGAATWECRLHGIVSPGLPSIGAPTHGTVAR